MPAGAVEDEYGVGARGDMAADLLDVQLHGLGVGEGKRERRAGSARGTNGAEQVGALVALVGGLDRPCSASRPLSDKAVLLADAGFILEPEFDGRALRQRRQMRLQDLGEVFLNAVTILSSCAGWRGRALTCEKPSRLRSVPT